MMLKYSKIAALTLLMVGLVASSAAAQDTDVMLNYATLRGAVSKDMAPAKDNLQTKAKNFIQSVSFDRGRVLVLPLAPRAQEGGKSMRLGVTVSVALGG